MRSALGTCLRRLDNWFYASLPRERLALLRLGTGLYALIYLLSRAAHLNSVVNYPATSFAPIGVIQVLATPLASTWVYGIYGASVVCAVLFTLGVAYRASAPAFAGLLLWVVSYRHSWGMIFHTDNLLVLHVGLLALAPAADAFAYRTKRGSTPLDTRSGRYGWAIRACCLVTVASYFVAGMAKLEHTGWAWADGVTLREQIAYDAIRKIELGSVYSPLGPWLLPQAWLFAPLSSLSLATELLAPLALLSRRVAAGWCIAAWSFHVGVLGLMAIAFPYPLSGCAFLAFFPLEDWLSRLRRRALAARAARVSAEARQT
jgi:vitamin K-dependent gamma-carboxylase-like protein